MAKVSRFRYGQVWKKGDTTITINMIFPKDPTQANVKRCSPKTCNDESISIDSLYKEGFIHIKNTYDELEKKRKI